LKLAIALLSTSAAGYQIDPLTLASPQDRRILARMKPYLITSGTIFGLITLAHFWRMIAENRKLATDPVFLLLTVLSTALCVWAFQLVRAYRRT